MFLDILLILLPLFLGYGLRLSSATLLKRLQWLTSQMVYLILALAWPSLTIWIST